ncbi:MAG: aminotransferase class I/II-fold pyridoxal phosphate-dependent enzyme, partial [Shewanella sp.]
MIFTEVSLAPADPILGLTDIFKADARAAKVNLGVGIYKDEAGNTPVLASVKRAEERLLSQETSKNYLGIEGVHAYNSGVLGLLFGKNNPLISSGRALAAQAPGGTGALRIAAEFLLRNTPSRTI